jgi:hypothetical protein
MTDQMQTKPRHEAGVTGDAVLFFYSFLLTEQKLTENHGHSRRISQGFIPKRSVLMKNLAHVQWQEIQSCKDFSFGVFSAGFTPLDSCYRQLRYAGFSGKLGYANHSVLSQFSHAISEQWHPSRILI